MVDGPGIFAPAASLLRQVPRWSGAESRSAGTELADIAVAAREAFAANSLGKARNVECDERKSSHQPEISARPPPTT
jgi:hypothetical protein